mmetsp:Transcript_23195/g.26447  ORF Transcript_23195/g.26447 Transcript_23195/m.26447 type:complete len:391 (+) Transcript_23195:2-1174(+)
MKAYRFSIAWPRIFPEGRGAVNPSGVNFYNTLINTLLENGIEPWVTLYHWDLPQALQDEYGGWLDREIINDFGEYARVCYSMFGDRVKHWITINESWSIAVNGYNNGVYAPGRAAHIETDTYTVGHHLILAHARAVKIYRSTFKEEQQGIVGISNCADYRYPKDNKSTLDNVAAQRAMIFQLGWFADPIWRGDYPKEMREILGNRLPIFSSEELLDVIGSSDFLGLNHYSSLLATTVQEPIFSGGYWADISVKFSSNPKWAKNAMGWSIVPDGCRDLLKWIDKRYGHPLIYMTENGSAFEENSREEALQDNDRQMYYEQYIRACREAIESGVELRGYFAWSLMDNFEWQFGYKRRFGLFYVDFDTLERTPKMSAEWYKSTIEANGGNIER